MRVIVGRRRSPSLFISGYFDCGPGHLEVRRYDAIEELRGADAVNGSGHPVDEDVLARLRS
jgi:hypothetical protein